jgi:hypothetical protein
MAALICTPVDCCGPVIGSSAPIFTVVCAWAEKAARLSAAAAIPVVVVLRNMAFPYQESEVSNQVPLDN